LGVDSDEACSSTPVGRHAVSATQDAFRDGVLIAAIPMLACGFCARRVVFPRCMLGARWRRNAGDLARRWRRFGDEHQRTGTGNHTDHEHANDAAGKIRH
jgi:hypothetical protein